MRDAPHKPTPSCRRRVHGEQLKIQIRWPFELMQPNGSHPFGRGLRPKQKHVGQASIRCCGFRKGTWTYGCDGPGSVIQSELRPWAG